MGEVLFWVITGGGGASFGVVISYKVNLVLVPASLTVFLVRRTSEQNVTDVAHRWLRVADKLDNNLFIRTVFDVVNNTNWEKTIRASFRSLFLGNTTTLINIMDKSFPELGLKRSDCQEMNWTQSVLWDLDIGVTRNGKNSFLEGTVYGVKYFKEANFRRLVKVKTMVDPDNFFRNEQSIPTLPSSWK
ncbi:hypothetical protein L1987_01582 [Smallanthus sonchifolius]|uniref:Uncharacterized protein n=1 Tax=Smallanthus sonchifolius TaxID=185202 RepID=A0ACB9K5C4_9ASTR|nr:hypothetical protein L1987_01582 [Smallanthus sonchifolius]